MKGLLVFLGVLFVCSVIGSKTEFVREEYIQNPKTANNVLVQYTAQDIPFITADTEEDLFFAQGKIVAYNRIWQMDFFRRYMLGTLSEIYGNVTLQSDINHRRMNWAGVCLTNIQNTPKEYIDKIGYV